MAATTKTHRLTLQELLDRRGEPPVAVDPESRGDAAAWQSHWAEALTWYDNVSRKNAHVAEKAGLCAEYLGNNDGAVSRIEPFLDSVSPVGVAIFTDCLDRSRPRGFSRTPSEDAPERVWERRAMYAVIKTDPRSYAFSELSGHDSLREAYDALEGHEFKRDLSLASITVTGDGEDHYTALGWQAVFAELRA